MLGKKTIRMNDSARDLMFEYSIEELIKNEKFKKEITKGKSLTWREIFKIMQKNKKYQRMLFKKVKELIKSKRGKEIKKTYKNNIKIERTKCKKVKIFVKLPKHFQNNSDLKKILKQKFLISKRHKIKKSKPIQKRKRRHHKLRSAINAKIHRKKMALRKKKIYYHSKNINKEIKKKIPKIY